ncbi:MAG: carboxy terminal-processing peptidase [Puniceicoccales bacterium]|nr:carboxy terminal-processing peptidase [Puniceicoccales bacterium]
MKQVSRRRKFANSLCMGCVLMLLICAVCGASTVADDASDDTLLQSREMRAETIYMVRFMEEVHLEHKDISLLDNKAILINFLTELDHGKMIFLQSEVDDIAKRFISTLDVFVSGGSLTPAFNIFKKFKASAVRRVDWIRDRLDKPFDFSVEDTFFSNADDREWPLTGNDADALWEKRLKFEVLGEAIKLCSSSRKDSKAADGEECGPMKYSENDVIGALGDAVKNVKRRYESWCKSYREIDAWLIQEMFLNSISKMYDPHTSFLSKYSFDDLSIHINNTLTGIGISFRDENGMFEVERLTPGGPAKLSGEITVGDKIIAVAQGDSGEFVDIVGLRSYKVVKLLRGEKGTVVRVKLETVTGDTKVVRLERDVIKLDASRASAKYFELQDGGVIARIGVIELPSFYGGGDAEDEQGVYADRDVDTLLKELKNRGVDAIVLDLRQNGGGLLNQAISITGLFITTGPVVQVKDYSGKIETFYDKNEYIAWEGPLVVLSSSESASASEILIGALRDNRRAVIVGAETTYGKGSAQMTFDMNRSFSQLGRNRDLGAACITVQKWYLPTGTSTQLKGIQADIKLRGLDECFHRREADFPHALKWDTIPPVEFDRNGERHMVECRATADLIATLAKRSEERQKTLEEFKILSERIESFDRIVNKKTFPLRISARLQEKRRDDEFRRRMNGAIGALKEKQDYPCENIYLPDAARDECENARNASKEDMDGIATLDTNLRESLRIAADWIRALNRGQLAEDCSFTHMPDIAVESMPR